MAKRLVAVVILVLALMQCHQRPCETDEECEQAPPQNPITRMIGITRAGLVLARRGLPEEILGAST